MAKVYRQTDRVTVELHDLTLKLKPLSFSEKMEIQREASKMSNEAMLEAVKLTLKYSLKDIKGLEYDDGEEFELSYDDNSHLSEESIETILNMEHTATLLTVCGQFAVAIPEKNFKDVDGSDLKGVKIIKKKKGKGPKKKAQ